jgi:leucyl-tRNA synthetase
MVWGVLKKPGFVVQAPYPTVPAEDKLMTRQSEFLCSCMKSWRQAITKAKVKPTDAVILVADEYPSWKNDALKWMHAQASGGKFPETFMADLKTWASSLPDKKMVSNVMQFVSFVKKEVEEVGLSAMDFTMPYDQSSILRDSMAYIKLGLNVEKLEIVNINKDALPEGCTDKQTSTAGPGKPGFWQRK